MNAKVIKQKEYEEDLKYRQERHLVYVKSRKEGIKEDPNWIPCKHDLCEKCIGTGIMEDGEKCDHSKIFCCCNKCCIRNGNGNSVYLFEYFQYKRIQEEISK